MRKAESRDGTVALQQGDQRQSYNKVNSDKMKGIVRGIALDHYAYEHTWQQINSKLQRRLLGSLTSAGQLGRSHGSLPDYIKNLESASVERNSESTKQARHGYAQ